MTPFPKGYERLGFLGEGGMCTVHRARHMATARVVAVKLLKPELACNPDDVQRFLREARICATLASPHIVRIFDVGRADDVPFLSMEYVDGTTLAALLADGLSARRGLTILVDVAEALATAHEAGVVHRDLKPDNVLVATDGSVRVADWGLSRGVVDTERLTRTGIVMGTPQYMAPEQITAGTLGPATDLYAFGVMLHEILAGRLPFADEDVTSVVQAHLRRRPPRLDGLPPDLSNLLDRLLAKSPADRPETAHDVADRLRTTLATTEDADLDVLRTIAPTVPTVRLAPPSAPSRRLLAWCAAALVLSALLLVGAHVLVPSPAPSPPAAVAGPFAIVAVDVEDPSLVVLRYTGEPPPPCSMLVTDDLAPARRLAVDFTNGERRSRTQFAVAVALTEPLLGPATGTFSPPVAPPISMDPTHRFAELLGPVDKLTGRRFGELVTAMLDFEHRMGVRRDAVKDGDELRQEFTPELLGILKRYDLAGPAAAAMGGFLDDAARARPYAGSALTRRLEPLCVVQALAGHGGLFDFPWGDAAAAAGYTVADGGDSSTTGASKLLAERSMATTAAPTEPGGPVRMRYTWICDGSCFSEVTSIPLGSLSISALGADESDRSGLQAAVRMRRDELFPNPGDFRGRCTGTLDVIPPSDEHWPPLRPFLEVLVRNMPRDMAMDVELNDHWLVGLINTGASCDGDILRPTRFQLFRIAVPPAWLNRGTNTFVLTGRTFPSHRSYSAIGVRHLSLVAGSD